MSATPNVGFTYVDKLISDSSDNSAGLAGIEKAYTDELATSDFDTAQGLAKIQFLSNKFGIHVQAVSAVISSLKSMMEAVARNI